MVRLVGMQVRHLIKESSPGHMGMIEITSLSDWLKKSCATLSAMHASLFLHALLWLHVIASVKFWLAHCAVTASLWQKNHSSCIILSLFSVPVYHSWQAFVVKSSIQTVERAGLLDQLSGRNNDVSNQSGIISVVSCVKIIIYLMIIIMMMMMMSNYLHGCMIIFILLRLIFDNS